MTTATNETQRVNVPTLEEVSDQNRQILEGLQAKVGMVPNIYATYAHSENALKRYLDFASGPTSFNNEEKEAINLVTSQVNGCTYCQAAHSALGQNLGFSEEQVKDLRRGQADWDVKLNALVKLAGAIAANRGQVDDAVVDDFFAQGYTKENMVDLVAAVGEKTITNYLHNLTGIPIDFPEVPALD